LKLATVAKLWLSSVRSPCLLQIPYSVVRLRGAGTIDSAFPRCLSKFALLSTVLLNISSRTCNHSHHLFPKQTVICPKFRRECANLSVVKDRETLNPSGAANCIAASSRKRTRAIFSICCR